MVSSQSTNSLATVLPNSGGSFAVQESDVGPNVLGSSTINPVVIQHLSVPLTTAQLEAMYATPVQIVPAPVTGAVIVFDRAVLRFTAGGTQFTSGGAVSLQLGTTNHAGGTLLTPTIAASVLNAATNSDTQIGCVANAAALTLLDATGVYISNATGPFATGNGSAIVDIYYAVLPAGV